MNRKMGVPMLVYHAVANLYQKGSILRQRWDTRQDRIQNVSTSRQHISRQTPGIDELKKDNNFIIIHLFNQVNISGRNLFEVFFWLSFLKNISDLGMIIHMLLAKSLHSFYHFFSLGLDTSSVTFTKGAHFSKNLIPLSCHSSLAFCPYLPSFLKSISMSSNYHDVIHFSCITWLHHGLMNECV